MLIDLEGPFKNKTVEAEYALDSILKCFDEIVLELTGNIENPSVNHLKTLIHSQTEGLVQQLKIFSAIFNISSMFSTHSSLNEILSLIVEKIKTGLNFSRVNILLLNEDRTLLECKIITGMTYRQKMRAQKLPISMNRHDCIETRVAKSGKSFLHNDINDELLTGIDLKIIKSMERQRTIYAPILSKNGIIGVLGVESLLSLPPLGTADVCRVQLFANHVGVLIENTKLYEAIIDHKNRYESIVEQSPNGILIASNGKIKHINTAGASILRIKKAEFLKQPVECLLGEELTEKLKYHLNKSRPTGFFEFHLKLHDQRRIVLNLSAVKIKIGSSVEQVFIFQDVTQKIISDSHLERLDKLASIGTIAAGIAHEIRSPLTSISMDLDSLYGSTLEEVKVRKTIAQALNEIERIDKIISNLLQFSRVSNDGFTHMDIVAIIEETLLLAKKKAANNGITFITILPKSIIIYGNPDKLRQILVNLLVNAIEAIGSKGEITIEANLIDKSSEQMHVVLELDTCDKCENVLRIAVKDTGRGIPVTIRKKIFDPYFTTKSTGAGLGLAISSKFVHEHKGTMAVHSELGEGAIFEIFIPNKITG